ncbi:Uncharacterised protein [Mycobacteroides abscessus subsp. abscessus]|nr:Uncharacterised protein [Mycobacteroides abscessus subsp. abscessus]
MPRSAPAISAITPTMPRMIGTTRPNSDSVSMLSLAMAICDSMVFSSKTRVDFSAVTSSCCGLRP